MILAQFAAPLVSAVISFVSNGGDTLQRFTGVSIPPRYCGLTIPAQVTVDFFHIDGHFIVACVK